MSTQGTAQRCFSRTDGIAHERFDILDISVSRINPFITARRSAECGYAVESHPSVCHSDRVCDDGLP